MDNPQQQFLDRRVRPPKRRLTQRTKLRWNRNSVFFDVGRYADGRPCEVFINTGKEGTEIQDLMGAFAIVTSLGLQYGIPASEIAKALRGFKEDSLPSMCACLLNEPNPYQVGVPVERLDGAASASAEREIRSSDEAALPQSESGLTKYEKEQNQ